METVRDYISFDLEFNKHQEKTHLIQVSAVHFKDGEEVEAFDSYVHSDVPLKSFINGLTGIIDNFILAEANLITNPYVKVKIITRGELEAKIDLKTQFASKTAIDMIKKAGGNFTKTKVPARPKAENNISE